MTKLLISLPLSDRAQKYYGSNTPTYNKVGDAGIDLPFIGDWQPYDVEVTETIGLISFGTIFAMYDLNSRGKYDSLEYLMQSFGFVYKDVLSSLSTIAYYYQPSHFDIRPRSSISKTPFRLANAIGTIDKTYRGLVTNFANQPNRLIGHSEILEADKLGCYLDYHPQLGIKPRKSSIAAGERLLQIVAPALDDILHVRLDFTEENCVFWSETISDKKRDGFGSSGR